MFVLTNYFTLLRAQSMRLRILWQRFLKSRKQGCLVPYRIASCIRKEFQISPNSANAITAGASSTAYVLFGWPHTVKNVCVEDQAESSKLLAANDCSNWRGLGDFGPDSSAIQIHGRWISILFVPTWKNAGQARLDVRPRCETKSFWPHESMYLSNASVIWYAAVVTLFGDVCDLICFCKINMNK